MCIQTFNKLAEPSVSTCFLLWYFVLLIRLALYSWENKKAVSNETEESSLDIKYN